MNQPTKPFAVNNTLKCAGCGAQLQFAPGTANLHCDYCGQDNPIRSGDEKTEVTATDYDAYIAGFESAGPNLSLKEVACSNCGSTTVLDEFVTSDKCPFCMSPLVLRQDQISNYVCPDYILPFGVTQQQSIAFFKKWLAGLWWTPNDLSKNAGMDTVGLKGVYLPHWSYDTDARTTYSGERGDYYYTTESYTETVDGKTETRTRQVRHTSWSYTSGTVDNDFRDLVVPATKSLPDKTLTNLNPWDFTQLVKFDERYMSGFRSETYQLDPRAGLVNALAQTEPVIDQSIRSDIGGDEQRVNSTDTDYRNKAIKYLMLPVWVSAYRYNSKVYQFTVNACTGEVIGERPLSAWKIAFAILFALLLIIIVIMYFQANAQ